ncbi:PREDICTED: myotubularin-related protein 4-like [Priapulus caudatus]|uniref:Myotubularin-related protein 4-like n=1 Tax=Priapulus caudatus TaxID=37621 RepID=A0ABM1DVN8_PRICU|nr:PREDICTED: myotubularin-related protein 4-like [Priapulus caudatus]
MDSGADDSEGPSVEHIQTSELFPCCSLRSDDPTLQVPYPVLCGEAVEFLGRTADGVITLSNYRLFIRSFADNSCVNMPIKLVEYVDVRDLCQLLIYCKDARTIRCSFEERYREDCMEWHRRLSLAINPMQKIEDCFAFAFYAWCMDQVEPTSLPFSQDGGYDFFKEIERMGFRLGEVWRICELNTNYKFCPTYPKYHLVPVWITDQELEKVAQFRAMKRIPSVVWR